MDFILRPINYTPQESADSPLEHLDAARRYLRQIAAAAKEPSLSAAIQMMSSQFEVLATNNGVPRPHGDREVFEGECHGCRRMTEMPVRPPYHCPKCGQRMELAWRDEPAK